MPSQKETPDDTTDNSKEEVNSSPGFLSETDQILALVHTMERVTERTTDAINKISEKLDSLNIVITELTKKMDESKKVSQPLQQDLTTLSQKLLDQTINILKSKNPTIPHSVNEEEK